MFPWLWHGVGMTDMWTVSLPPGEKLLNLNDRVHWRTRDRITRQIRGDSATLVRAARVPSLDRVTMEGVLHPHDRRRRDPHNWVPSFKAMIDGVVDAGVLADDDAKHLLSFTISLGEPVRHGQLSLIIRRAEPEGS